MIIRKKLKRVVLNNSKSSTWKVAQKEWTLKSYEKLDGDKTVTCSCGRKELRVYTVVENTLTNKTLNLGKGCVNTLFNIYWRNRFFPGIQKGILNPEIILEAQKDGLISGDDCDFLLKNYKYRTLRSYKQAKVNNLKESIIFSYRVMKKWSRKGGIDSKRVRTKSGLH